jgi:hypothetical protein
MNLTNATWTLDSRTVSLGNFAPGAHSFVVDNLPNLPNGEHRLVIRGRTSAGAVSVAIPFNNEQLGPLTVARALPIYVLIEGLGLRSITPSLVLHAVSWRWTLPGARFDARLISGSGGLNTSLPRAGYVHAVNARLVVGGQPFQFVESPSLGNPLTWGTGLAGNASGAPLPIDSFVHSNTTPLAFECAGLTTGTGGTAPWVFLGSNPTRGRMDFTLGDCARTTKVR